MIQLLKLLHLFISLPSSFIFRIPFDLWVLLKLSLQDSRTVDESMGWELTS